jgi:hypothetical protein
MTSTEVVQMDKKVDLPDMRCDGCLEPIGPDRAATVSGPAVKRPHPFTREDQKDPVKIQCFDCRKSGRQDEFGDEIYEIEIGGKPVEVRCDQCGDPIQPPVEFYTYQELPNHQVELKTCCSRECFKKVG